MLLMVDAMKIIFTRHAAQKLAQRNIKKEMVRATIRAPLKLVADVGKFYAFRKFGKIYLKVVFSRAGDSVVIVTQYFVDALP